MKTIWHVIVPALVYELLLTATAGLLPSADRVVSVLISAILGIVLFGTWFLEDQKISGKRVVRQRLSHRQLGLILILGISSCILVNNLIEMSRIDEIFVRIQEVTKDLYAPSFFIQILSIGVVIPIAEELVFRGMVYRRLKENCSVRVSCVISAFVFAVFHGDIVQGLYAFVLGVLMAWVYEWYHTLEASVTFHISANVCSVLLTGLLKQYEVNRTDISFMIMTILMAGLLVRTVGKIMKEDKKEVLS